MEKAQTVNEKESSSALGIDLEEFRKQFLDAKDVDRRIELLNSCPNVRNLLSTPNFFRVFLQGIAPEYECALKQCVAIGQVVDQDSLSPEKWRQFLQELLAIDRFYREIGGIIGYQTEVLKLLQKKGAPSIAGVGFHSPVFEDISRESEEVLAAIQDGLEGLPFVAELYPLGGAADRLHLTDEKTGMELPAAKLQFAGHTLLETLIRDLQAREWLYFCRYGKQLHTPIAIMISEEKGNHEHVIKICEEHEWFGRPKELFRLFNQPLVPMVDEQGNWHTTGPLKLLLKPGGHGAIWKLARDDGIFAWLKSLGYKKALVRQINNPIAGLDYGLIAFTGIGCKKNMSFGFASCCRLVKSAEGMIVLVEKEDGRIALTNIEYCDFEKFGIEDKPLYPGKPYSRFTSNTNILFVDLDAVEKAVQSHPFPGLLMNLKTFGKESKLGRLESTMQNIADAFAEEKKGDFPLKTEKTFATYNLRHKTISVAKKAYIPGKSLLETPEQCFYELLSANRELLVECGFSVPREHSVENYLEKGSASLFLYHPALGPLYSIIRKKIRGGSLSTGSELFLEIADVDFEQVSIEGSLRVIAERVIGKKNSESHLIYTKQVGRCRLHNVRIKNEGVDWAESSPYWKMDLKRTETLQIDLKGYSQFDAQDCTFEGPYHFIVEHGTRMSVRQEEDQLIFNTTILESEEQI